MRDEICVKIDSLTQSATFAIMKFFPQTISSRNLIQKNQNQSEISQNLPTDANLK